MGPGLDIPHPLPNKKTRTIPWKTLTMTVTTTSSPSTAITYKPRSSETLLHMSPIISLESTNSITLRSIDFGVACNSSSVLPVQLLL